MLYDQQTVRRNVAQVRLRGPKNNFGSGYLIGVNLILTARHVVMPKAMDTASAKCQVRLRRGRPSYSRSEDWPWTDANLAWVGAHTVDLALLKVMPEEGTPDWDPRLKVRFGRIDITQYPRVQGFGFPSGAVYEEKSRPFDPCGKLDEQEEALSFGIDQCDQPDSPDRDWGGFSGAALLLMEESAGPHSRSIEPDVVWIYGVARRVPRRFRRRLKVGPIDEDTVWEDETFKSLLREARVSDTRPTDPLKLQLFERYLTWNGFRSVCQMQLDRRCGGTRYQNEHSVYVNRVAQENEIGRFLESNKRVLPLIGESGTGKTSLIGHLTERPPSAPTVLLQGRELDKSSRSVATEVFRTLGEVEPHFFGSVSDRSLKLLRRENDFVLVLLDGLNEVEGLGLEWMRAWLESTGDWLRDQPVRMIISCRPEYWNSVYHSLAPELLYEPQFTPGANATTRSLSRLGVQIGDFNDEEATDAFKKYGFGLPGRDLPIFHHPVLFHIYKYLGRSADREQPSLYGLFDAYLNEILGKVGRGSRGFLDFKLGRIAKYLQGQKTLWFDVDAQDEEWAAKLIEERLLAKGTDSVRFALDETAYFVVAKFGSDIETAFGEGAWLDLREDARVLWDATPFVLCRYEHQHKETSLQEILAQIAGYAHTSVLDDASEGIKGIEIHQLFLRSIQWLRDPSPYFEEIRQFIKNCAKSRDSHEMHHPLFPLCALPGLSSTQRYRLLQVLASREPDWWRWRDWENLSDDVFWGDDHGLYGGNEFKDFLRRQIEKEGSTAISQILEWIDDETRQRSSDQYEAESRVGDLGCAILFHSDPEWVHLIANSLVTNIIARTGHARRLLDLIAQHRPLEMTAVLEEWGPYHPLLKQYSSCVLGTKPDGAIAERVARILDVALEESQPGSELGVLEALSLVPSRATQVLERLENLVDVPASLGIPEIVVRLYSTAPERALHILTLLAERGDPWSRHEALDALSRLRSKESPPPKI